MKDMKAPARTVLIVSILALFVLGVVSTPAVAQEAPADEGEGAPGDKAPPPGLFGGSPLMMMVIILGIFYVIVIMPKQKEQKKHQERVNQLKAGDRVLTSGGIYGTVKRHKPDENRLTVEIAKDVKVEIARGAISTVIERGEQEN